MVSASPVNPIQISPVGVASVNAQEGQNISQASYLGLSIFDARRISNPKPLSEYAIQRLTTISDIFDQEELSTSSSIQLLYNLSQPDEVFIPMRPKLEKIFRERFTPALLHRHLNNMIIFILCFECREFVSFFRWPMIDTERLIRNQLSLLSVNSLMKAAKWIGGSEDENFLKHLVLFLELDGKHKAPDSNGKKKSNASLLPNAVRNFLVSDAMLSEETPTSLFEANAVYSSQVMK